MNRHFKDSVYYLKRAGSTAKEGVKEEVSPVTSRVKARFGSAEDEEETRMERLRGRAVATKARVTAEVGKLRAKVLERKKAV